MRVPSLHSFFDRRLHLVGVNESREEAVQLVVCGVRRPVRLEEPERLRERSSGGDSPVEVLVEVLQERSRLKMMVG